MKVLVTGATGYIGGRLVPVLLARGHEVRCGARTPAKLDGRPWRDEVEVVRLDVTEPATLRAATRGMDVVYHLVHAMDGEENFAERDRQAAADVRDACEATGVSRIVYLGGLGDPDDDLSEHLRSRHETGRVLADGPVPVTELRAAIIIGSGSASFEMLRNLVEVLPVMVTPKWVGNRCQPIAIRDVLFYLCEVLEHDDTAGRVLEIGGPDVMSYAGLMQSYAELAGIRRRWILRVPVLTPGLSSLWIGLVTPLPTGLARPLVDSLVNEVVVRDRPIADYITRETTPFRDSVQLALQRIQDLEVDTTWAGAQWRRPAAVAGDADGAGGDQAARPLPEDPDWSGGTVLSDDRTAVSKAPPEALWATVCSLGGERGYHSPRWLWRARGLLDKLVGGIGLRRGRRHPHQLSVGEPIDFWRVERLEHPRLLLLRAEMRLPGQAWLELRVEPEGDGSRLVQRARFHPRGLLGRLYWGVLFPFHHLIFPRMAREIAAEAERVPLAALDDPPAPGDDPPAPGDDPPAPGDDPPAPGDDPPAGAHG